MKKLYIVLATLFISITLFAPVMAAPGGGAISKTLGFGTLNPENAFYKFRIPQGGMYCEGKIRYYKQGNRQISTIKMSGSECSYAALKVDYGNGYERWIPSEDVNVVPTVNEPISKRIKQIMYQLCSVQEDSQERVCTRVHRTRAVN